MQDDAAIADAVNRRTIPGTKPAAATVVTACVVTSLAASRRSSWPHAMTGVYQSLMLTTILLITSYHLPHVEDRCGCANTARFCCGANTMNPCRVVVTVDFRFTFCSFDQPRWWWRTVAKELLSVLGRQGRSLTAPLLHRLDEIAADCAEAMSDDDDDTGDSPKGVLATVAVAIQSLGPEHVLDTVPLHLEEVTCCVLCLFSISLFATRCMACCDRTHIEQPSADSRSWW